MSHEIRSPMNVILGLTRHLSRGSLSREPPIGRSKITGQGSCTPVFTKEKNGAGGPTNCESTMPA